MNESSNRQKKSRLGAIEDMVKTNILTGVGSVLSIGGSYRIDCSTKSVVGSDFDAIKNDWKSVGKEISVAMKNFSVR